MRLAKEKNGFTLVELMVALVVLTLGLFSVIHLQIVTIRGHSYAREREEAYQIAQGIIEEMKIRNLEWVDLRMLDPDLEEFDDHSQGLIISPSPLYGNDIDIADIRALRLYGGTDIAADDNPQSAAPINIFARNPTADPGLPGARGAYRVHYVAYHVRPENLDGPDLDMVRVILFVSWESKDHGTDVDWSGGGWWNTGTYWDRHMVSVTAYLKKNRRY